MPQDTTYPEYQEVHLGVCHEIFYFLKLLHTSEGQFAIALAEQPENFRGKIKYIFSIKCPVSLKSVMDGGGDSVTWSVTQGFLPAYSNYQVQ